MLARIDLYSLHILTGLCAFILCRRNQKSHVATNIVHKLYRIQTIAPQPFSYFEKLVSPAAIESSKKKQSGPKRTWYTLTLEALNAVLYQVSFEIVPNDFSSQFILIIRL